MHNHILDKYRQSVHDALVLLKRNAVEDLQNGVQFRRWSPSAPATTPEEIALVAVQKSARIAALQEAIDTINDTYRQLFEKEDDD